MVKILASLQKFDMNSAPRPETFSYRKLLSIVLIPESASSTLVVTQDE